MVEQRIQFCTAHDGAKIAYAVTGNGPPLVRAAHYLSHLEFDFESPVWRHWIRELSKYNTYVRYDERGCGLSDQDPPEFSFNAWVSDLETVVDSLGLDKFDLLGVSQGGAVAIDYTSMHPQRVKHLILYGAYARGWGKRTGTATSLRALEARRSMHKLIELGWGQDNPAFRQMFTSLFVPEGGQEQQHWFNELQRVSCSPKNALMFDEVFTSIDVSSLLEKIAVPTLVLHARDDSVVPFEEGRLLASKIPGSRFTSFEGRNHILLETEPSWRTFLQEFRRFVGASVEEIPTRAQEMGAGQADGMALDFLVGRDELDLSRYSVSGSYVRYDESTRNLLKDLVQRLTKALESSARNHENYLIWAPPGSGKTSFVRQVRSRFGAGVHYSEVNLAETDELEFRNLLASVSGQEGPSMLFVDEVDSRSAETWPYEALLASMDVEKVPNRAVYVLAGSTGADLHEMKNLISARPKGRDIITRIPHGNEYSVPSLTRIDNILVFLSALDGAANELGRGFDEVEKLGLYFVATSPQLTNARRLREFALRALERVPKGDRRLKYDNLFEPGDPDNKEFWLTQGKSTPRLVNSFLRFRAGLESGTAEGERKLGAIMFTDTVGSTALAQKDEALAMELLDQQRRLIRPLLAFNKGREVKTIGDGFLVEFSSALDAVKCAAAIQAAQEEANKQRTADRRSQIRIGIHLGDVIHIGTDIAGDAVNVASRIEPLAPPGGISVTAQVYASVYNKVQFRFESLGTPQLKGVDAPIEVYKVVGFGPETWESPLRKRNLSERIAVLPLANFSPANEDEFFADGMTEEIISAISRISGLKVIARTSVMRYKGKDKPAAVIGRELGVGSLLQGSVRKMGMKVRINVQLVDAVEEEPRWSEDYDRDLHDIFAVQRDIGEKVAQALKVQVLQRELRGMAKEATQSPDAYVRYLRGRQLWNKRTKADLEEALRHFEGAARIDPSYAKAYSGMADSYAMLASYATEFLPPAVAFPKALASARRALELDPALAEAHTSLGVVKFHYDWDWRGAEEEFKEAIRLNPNYAPAHQFYADFLKGMGRFEEAIGEIRKAQELDPLALSITAAVGHVLYLARRYDEAIEWYRKAVELDPDFMPTHIWFGRPYLEKGMYEEAISELRIGVKLSGGSNVALAMLGHGLASAGMDKEAREVLQKLIERSKTEYVPSYWIAVVYNGMKDRENVMAWLRRAFRERSSWLVWSNVEPRFAWLRDDPDFRSLMGAMKFP